MLRNTFCHLPGIGQVTENHIWEAGYLCWDDVLNYRKESGHKKVERLRSLLERSLHEYDLRNINFFSETLPVNQHWRLFPDFRDTVAYLDIETTGLDFSGSHITTIAVYDGKDVSCFINGDNLDDFPDYIDKYKLLVTYSGKTFDVPVIEKEFCIKLTPAHVDLRYILKSLGYTGGLKHCERTLGFERGYLHNVDGYMAVLLWHEFSRTGERKFLETLLAYNVADVLSLENLLIFSFNEKLKQTPFYDHQQIQNHIPAVNPFAPDVFVLDALKHKVYGQDRW